MNKPKDFYVCPSVCLCRSDEIEVEVFPVLGRTIRGAPKGVPAASGAPPAELGLPGRPAVPGHHARRPVF